MVVMEGGLLLGLERAGGCGGGERENGWSGLVAVGCRLGSYGSAMKDGKGDKDKEECGCGSLVWV